MATKKKEPAAPAAEAAQRAAGEMVTVELSRPRKWVPEGSKTAVTYPAGKQSIPLAMAQGLGLVEGGPAPAAAPQGDAPDSSAVSDLYAIVDTLTGRIQELEAFVEALGADSSKTNSDAAKKDGK